MREILKNDVPQDSPDPAILSFSGPRSKCVEVLRETISALTDLESNMQESTGEQWHPVNYTATVALMDNHPTHATCIRAKKDATVGLGFKNDYDEQLRLYKLDPIKNPPPTSSPDELSKVQIALDPICECGFMSLLHECVEDLENTGNGYIEVVRRGGAVASLWHLPSKDVKVFIESNGGKKHYVCTGVTERKFSVFGDKDDFISRNSVRKPADEVSEVIHLKRPSSRSRHYGGIDWLAAVPAMELSAMSVQQQYDFFNNRGVPEFFALFKGALIGKEEWDKIVSSLRATIGAGNRHKSVAVNISNPSLELQVERLGLDAVDSNAFPLLQETLSAIIVSAHRVPPMLAGIQTPGKLGANNELPNSLMSFQTLYIGPQQSRLSDALARTLGAETGLTRADFQLRAVTDAFDLKSMDTLARMKEPVVGSGRDPGKGLKD